MTEYEVPVEIVTTASRVVYENPWLRVTEDDVRRPDGSSGVYGVVHKPDFSLVVPLTSHGFHLVEQYRYPARGRYWEFPQGSWEEDPEVDPEDLARGELAEETGLRAGELRKLGVLHESYGFATQRGHVYLATDLTDGVASPEPEEGDLRCRHVPFEQFPRMVAAGQITDAVTIAAYGLVLLDRGITVTS
jgi:8-oxo-dGTP pyrophosphatase MutT (NUDIX family)